MGELVGWLLGELVVGEPVGGILGELVVGELVGVDTTTTSGRQEREYRTQCSGPYTPINQMTW